MDVSEGPQPEVRSFNELMNDRALSLKLDHYQRAFVWDEQRVRKLVDDLAEYASKHQIPSTGGEARPEYAYYMGTVLLSKESDQKSVNRDTLFVIDGQQRLAALSLLWSAVRGDGEIPPAMGFSYRDRRARKNLKAAYRTIGDRLPSPSLDTHLFEHITLTVVTTKSLDEAFTFFDSQNSRGVPLHTTDLLKAHHLRAIRNGKEESVQVEPIQRDSARRWEGMQQASQTGNLPAGEDPVHRLFNYYLWRGRNWFGDLNSRPLYPSRKALQKTFKQDAYPPRELEDRLRGRPPEAVNGGKESRLAKGGIDRVACFPSTARVHHSVVKWEPHQKDWDMEIGLPSLGTAPHNLPFTLRQPISEGAGFFLYAERYATLLEAMEEPPEIEHKPGRRSGDDWIDFCHLYQKVVLQLSHYLRQAFLMASMLYIDRFGTCRLYEFALWLEYILGAERLSKFSVFQASSKSVLNRIGGNGEAVGNLLDFIALNEIPDPVIRVLRDDKAADEALLWGLNDMTNSPKKVDAHSVRGRYIRALRHYFRGELEPKVVLPSDAEQCRSWFDERRKWITELFD